MKVTTASHVSEHSTVLKWLNGHSPPVTSPDSGKLIVASPMRECGMVKAPSKMPIPTGWPPEPIGRLQLPSTLSQPPTSTVTESMTRVENVVALSPNEASSPPPFVSPTEWLVQRTWMPFPPLMTYDPRVTDAVPRAPEESSASRPV